MCQAQVVVEVEVGVELGNYLLLLSGMTYPGEAETINLEITKNKIGFICIKEVDSFPEKLLPRQLVDNC